MLWRYLMIAELFLEETFTFSLHPKNSHCEKANNPEGGLTAPPGY
ncbi:MULTISPECIES: hypothetical protein [Paenibacillus]|nr:MULTISPECIES: hypothetical protein [Paenibacillus]